MTHRYIPNTGKTREEMMEEIGIDSVEELFSDIPSNFLLDKDLDIPKLSEPELEQYIDSIITKNSPYTKMISFLGGGVWPHHVPEHIRYLTQRSEYLTAYSPYQPEVNQGILQALFEYQSLIAEITGLPAVNSSVYDWASAIGEAALMSARLRDGEKFLVPELMSPERLSVLKSYASGPGLSIVKVDQDRDTGQIDLSDLEKKVDKQTVGVYIENPNYLGVIEEDPEKIAKISKAENAVFIVGVNPISLGILKPPAKYGADIVVGEGQPLGIPANFGGCLLGIFASRSDQEFAQQIPGRMMGMTETEEGGTRGFALALQERVQHISRAEATSNLCTTQALNAVSAAIYLSSLGPSGLREVAEKCAGNARYLREQLNQVRGVEAPIFDSSHFNEFVVSFEDFKKSPKEINSQLLDRGIHGGKPLEGAFSDFGNSSLWCATEIHQKADIDWMIDSMKDILEV